jgi:peptide/nickel transport system substrate-binding protein
MNTNGSRTDTGRRYGRRQVLRGGAGVAAGTTAFLLACGGGKPAATPAPSGGALQGTAAPAAAAGTQTVRRGGRLLLHWANTVGNNSPFSDWTQGFVLLGENVYDRPISTRPSKEYVLEAAASVEQPDPQTVIYKLKPGLRYQDRAPVSGRAVHAMDIVKTQQYIRDNPKSVHTTFQTGYLQTAEAPDAQTVVYKLKTPSGYLFSGTLLANTSAQSIVPAEQLDTIETAWPIGSGPYQVAEFDQNQRYLYRRFEGYRESGRGMPLIDERETKIVNDAAAQEAAFRSEQLHIWRGSPGYSIVEPLKRDIGSKIEIDEWPSLGMWTLALNGTKAPWNDVRVREAMYRVTNRQQYLNLLDDGKGQVCPGTLSVGLTEYQVDLKQTEKYWQQDAKAAKQLLDAAAFPYNREVEMIVIQGAKNQQAGEIFQQQVAPLGIKVRVLQMPFAEWLGSRVTPGNWETWVASHPSYDTPQIAMRQQHTETFNGHRWSGLKDPAVDKMIEKSEVTLDRNDRIKQVKDIQIALLEKYTPFMFLYSPTVYQPRYKFVRDWELNPATNPMYRIEAWLDK